MKANTYGIGYSPASGYYVVINGERQLELFATCEEARAFCLQRRISVTTCSVHGTYSDLCWVCPGCYEELNGDQSEPLGESDEGGEA